ncbi:DUF401 family protein [Spirochaeta thermophila]|nr:DUF401 family protein [Spirochaeta thermophila]
MMTFFVQISDLLVLLVVFSLIVIAYLFLKNITISILVGMAGMILFYGIPIADFFLSFLPGRAFTLPMLFFFLVIIGVMALSSLLKEAGLVDSVVRIVERRVRYPWSLAVFPALVGLLPMPGGAIFSAPMVARADRSERLSGAQRAVVNYWFRHLWEYWLPLYPGVLLAVELSGMSTLSFMRNHAVFMVLALVVGYVVYLRAVTRAGGGRGEEEDAGAGDGLRAPFLEIGIVLGVYVLGSVLFPGVRGGRYLWLALGVWSAIAVLLVRTDIPGGKVRGVFFGKRLWSLVLLVMLIRVYGFLFEFPSDGGTLAERIAGSLSGAGIPPVVVLVFLPFIAGLVLGIAVGFVGVSFPVVMGLLSGMGVERVGPYVMLAYVAGYIGMMLSPLHVCFVVSSEYFESHLFRNMRLLAVPLVVIAAGAGGYFFVLKAFGW